MPLNGRQGLTHWLPGQLQRSARLGSWLDLKTNGCSQIGLICSWHHQGKLPAGRMHPVAGTRHFDKNGISLKMNLFVRKGFLLGI